MAARESRCRLPPAACRAAGRPRIPAIHFDVDPVTGIATPRTAIPNLTTVRRKARQTEDRRTAVALFLGRPLAGFGRRARHSALAATTSLALASPFSPRRSAPSRRRQSLAVGKAHRQIGAVDVAVLMVAITTARSTYSSLRERGLLPGGCFGPSIPRQDERIFQLAPD